MFLLKKPRFFLSLIISLLTLISVGCSVIKQDSKAAQIPDKPLTSLTVTSPSQVTIMPEKTPIKIMPLGDSITDGYNFPGGYRINLWRELNNRGYQIQFVGSLSNGPDSLPNQNHEGHSGWRIDQINLYMKVWLQKAKPDLILLTIGTNDIVQNYQVKTAPERLNNLIDDIFQELPKVEILVASLPPIEVAAVNKQVNEYNRAIAAMVERRQRQGDRLKLVDLNSALNFDDLEDTVHPNGQGHSKMAKVWEKALVPLLENQLIGN